MIPLKFWRLKALKWASEQMHWLNGRVLQAYHSESHRLFREAVGPEWLAKTVQEIYPHTDWKAQRKGFRKGGDS
jgi:hypothetical protein